MSHQGIQYITPSLRLAQAGNKLANCLVNLLSCNFFPSFWCWIYASTFVVIIWSRKSLRNKAISIAAVIPSSGNSFKDVALALGNSLVETFFTADDQLKNKGLKSGLPLMHNSSPAMGLAAFKHCPL
eukprot:7677156-Ditylum_brightwellii.AAC.1